MFMNTTNDQKDVQVKPTGKRRSCLGCLGRGVIGLLALLAILMIVGAIYESAAMANDLKKYPMPGKLIDMGGYRIHLYCTGERTAGEPTVILESGTGAASPDWGLVQPEISKITRVCSYDRAGYGWSDKGPLPRTSKYLAEELHTLLTKSGEEGPYVLVGHSFGGHVIRLFAHQYPQEVIGMVLVDARPEELALRPAVSEFQLTIGAFMARFGFFHLLGKVYMKPEILETLPQNYPWPFMFYPHTMETMRDENPLESDKQVLDSGNLGDLPLFVIVHGNPSMFANLPAEDALLAEADWQAAQKKLAASSSNSQLVVAEGSGHGITFERPDVIIDAIQQILASVGD
jgi:pimeloyl-ACP methyl ester carboxylesterase